ncbi:MAG TPA: chromosomal replication initiator protein DnaA [Saprospiraceae bacterium]|nr:chromosomal replication initiator protein DnaA [Saprospiraceae bacterium]
MILENTQPEPSQDISSEITTVANNAKDLWRQCLNIIRDRVNNQSFKTWFEPIVPMQFVGRRFTIQVPSQFFSEWLEEHYYSLLNEVLAQVTHNEVSLNYEISSEDRDMAAPAENAQPNKPQQTLGSRFPEATDASAHKDQMSQQYCERSLNPRYTFENYIKGDSNQFARAAALAVANNPGGTSFNPLVIYGGVGLGKTHLVHAIGNSLIQSGKTQRVLYVSSEKFTVDFVEAIQKDNIAEFSNQYRSVDLLIVDDIQFFAGKEKTQDIFFHTFNTLHHLGKQIVLSSDKPPKELKGLNDRLISRFQWGLTADIQPPDLETRIAILRKKSSDDGIELAQDVLEFIASNVTTNIRELEGCLISLLARASLESRTIDLPLTKNVVRSIIGEVRTHVTVEEIQRTVCDHLHIPEDLLRAKTRKQEVVNARQIAMYLTKELTNSSLKTIGLHFGGRDHSTVIHAYQTVEDSMKNNPKQRNIIQQLRSKLELGIR